jgi:hypothetical protein
VKILKKKGTNGVSWTKISAVEKKRTMVRQLLALEQLHR